MTTTTDFIREMLELCEKATPGPWKHWPMLSGSENHRGYKVAADTHVAEVFPLDQDGVEGGHNAAFIAAARTVLPEALDRLERLEKVAEAGQRVVLDRTQFCDWDFDELDKALREAGYGG